MIDALSSGDLLGTGLWLLFFASSALTISLGLIFAYHWFVHAHNTLMSIIAMCAYVAVSFLLLSSMLAAITLG
jgi:hypothetical protein